MASILIVDDDLKLCKALSNELREFGYDTSTAGSVNEAVKFINKNKNIDLILLDLKLPGRDGLHLLRALREKNLNYKVIILTAYADIQSAMESTELGACDFISKPYEFDELLESIRKALQIKDHET